MQAYTMVSPAAVSCKVRRLQLLRRHLLLTWEDKVFIAISLALFLSRAAAAFFHLYAVAVVILIVSLAFRRTLGVGLVRMAVLTSTLFIAQRVKGFPIRLPVMEVAGLAGCGLIAGALGEWQRRTHEALRRSFCQTLDVLARALECRDPYTEGHSRRTARYAVATAREMELDEETVAVIEQAGLLHDLGKMGMPDAILRKKGGLTLEEERQVKRHPEEGSRILEAIPALAKAATLVRHHHEHYDGSGYPDGLADGTIPPAARILAVADAFDALTTDRPYRKGSSFLEALEHIKHDAGKIFDPAAVQALEKAWRNGRLAPDSDSEAIAA